MFMEHLLADINNSINGTARRLRSDSPFGGNIYIMTGVATALGISAIYLASGIVVSSLALAFKASCYGLAISYFSKNPNLAVDFAAVADSVWALVKNPSTQFPIFIQNAQNVISSEWASLVRLLKGNRPLFDGSILDGERGRLRATLTFAITTLLMTMLAYSTFFVALGITVKAALAAGLSAASFYVLDVRKNPTIWNRDINTLISAENLYDKLELLNEGSGNLLQVKFSAFAAFLRHEHFSAPAPGAEDGQPQQPAIPPAVLEEVPVELRQLSRMATLLFSTAQEAGAAIRSGFAPGNR